MENTNDRKKMKEKKTVGNKSYVKERSKGKRTKGVKDNEYNVTTGKGSEGKEKGRR